MDYLVRIKNNIPQNKEGLTEIQQQDILEKINKEKEFADYISKIIVPNYANQVRFTYPSKF